MHATDLPTLNAALNTLSAILLVLGYRAVKAGDHQRHRHFMSAALCTSTLFLISYLFYHYLVGSVPYPHHDWTRPIYFLVLIPHVVLAAVMVPFILKAVWHAWKGQFEHHKRITRWLWPVWIFVSVSCVVVYWMLYRL